MFTHAIKVNFSTDFLNVCGDYEFINVYHGYTKWINNLMIKLISKHQGK